MLFKHWPKSRTSKHIKCYFLAIWTFKHLQKILEFFTRNSKEFFFLMCFWSSCDHKKQKLQVVRGAITHKLQLHQKGSDSHYLKEDTGSEKQ